MQPSKVTEIPAMLRQMAQAVESLPDFRTLPTLHNLSLKWDNDSDALMLSGQLAAVSGDMKIISQLNTWATALCGSLLLGDENSTSIDGLYWRRLTVLARLSNGLLFEVWDHLNYTVPEVPAPVAV